MHLLVIILQTSSITSSVGQRDAVIDKLEERIVSLEDRLNEMKPKPNSDDRVTTP